MDFTDLPAAALSTLSRVEGAIDDDQLLFALSTVGRTLRSDVERLERALVQELRDRGESWATIASALGISRQSAHERFSVS